MDTRGDHGELVRTARRISRGFARDIDAVGPLGPPARRREPLAGYLARVVVGQQLSTTAARTIWARLESLAAEAGGSLPGVATQVPETALRACGLSGNKVRALGALASAEATGALAARRLARLAPDARHATLLALHGIGPWSAQMAALFYFREPDVWPIGDVSVRKTFARYVEAQSRWDFDGAAALFAPRRSLLARYLWRLADATP